MSTFRFDKLYFDELGKGISTGINFDDVIDLNFDSEGNIQIVSTATITLAQEKYIAAEVLDLTITSVFSEGENYAKYVDLMELVPLKFRDSTVLQEFLEECGILTGTWIGNINDIEKLLDKYNVGTDYIQYLADLVGYQIIRADTATIDEKRRQLIQVIDWYKEKGTYTSLSHIAYVLGFNLNIWDMYTSDYATFTQEEWFTGHENENPVGLSASYYKSPHIGVEIVLNKSFGDASDDYLFIAGMKTDLTEYVESVRPVNVVVNYSMFLNPITTESGEVYTSLGNVNACVNRDWEFTRKYFDDSSDLYFDSNAVIQPTHAFFDYTKTSFLDGITKYQLGTGRINTLPNEADIQLETPVISGSGVTYTVYSDRIEFTLNIDTTVVQAGITELGLFLNDGTTMVAEATFPSIAKVAGIALRVVFTIYV